MKLVILVLLTTAFLAENLQPQTKSQIPRYDYAAIIAVTPATSKICYFEATGARVVDISGKHTNSGLSVSGDALAAAITLLGDSGYDMVGESPFTGALDFNLGLGKNLEVIYFKRPKT